VTDGQTDRQIEWPFAIVWSNVDRSMLITVLQMIYSYLQLTIIMYIDTVYND